MDVTGYLRVVDCGLAKQIPSEVMADGETRTKHRSYSVCGTTEYLAPEIVFRDGHDKAVDLWALGVRERLYPHQLIYSSIRYVSCGVALY